jgi:hypothetical protein
MSQASPRCYANAEERAAFQTELQALAKRENRGYLAADRNGMPLFQEKIRARAYGTGFEFQGMALSPTVQQAGPAGVTPSQLLSAADGAYSAGSQTYRGSVMPTWHPNAMQWNREGRHSADIIAESNQRTNFKEPVTFCGVACLSYKSSRCSP